MPKTRENKPKRWIIESLLFCSFPAKNKEREEAKFKKFKKNLSEKRHSSSKSLSANDSNTRARIKEQQRQRQRGRSFERARASENNYTGFLSKRKSREDGFVVYFFCKILLRKSCRREEVSEVVARDLTSSRKRRRLWI